MLSRHIFPVMHPLSYLFLAVTLLCPALLSAATAIETKTVSAPSLSVRPPQKVMLGLQNARLIIHDSPAVYQQDGRAHVSFIIPYNAQNLKLLSNDTTLEALTWREEVIVPERWPENAGMHSRQRDTLFQQKNTLENELLANLTHQQILTKTPDAFTSAQEMEKLALLVQKSLPELKKRESVLRKQLEQLEKELNNIPQAEPRLRRIIVEPGKKMATGAQLPLTYSYTLTNVGWRPRYQFRALPEKETVHVTLEAEVWQYSGIDWTGAQVDLIMQGDSRREPSPIRPWIINEKGEDHQLSLRASGVNKRVRAPQMLESSAVAEDAVMDVMAQAAPPVRVENAAYSSWRLPSRAIAEGKEYIRLRQDVWKSPMQWLARPRNNGSAMWLVVRHKIDDIQAWPQASASFFIEDVSVGDGFFSPFTTSSGNKPIPVKSIAPVAANPKSLTATKDEPDSDEDKTDLFFGIDPRMTFQITTNVKQKGSGGFLNLKQNWNWSWDFTVINGRSTPAKVRIEEPEPQLTTAEGTIEYNCSPKPEKTKNHVLFWDLDVPASGKSHVRYALVVKP